MLPAKYSCMNILKQSEFEQLEDIIATIYFLRTRAWHRGRRGFENDPYQGFSSIIFARGMVSHKILDNLTLIFYG